jgi:hypothetical protein
VYGFSSKDKIRGISFQVKTLNKRVMFGLTSTVSTSESYTDITNAVYLQNNGYISIREKNSNKGQMGKYNANSVIEVVVNPEGYPVYKVDGEIRYTSRTKATYPLYVDGSFHDTGCELTDIKWVGAMEVTKDEVGGKIQFTNFKYAASEAPGSLRRVLGSGNSWNGGAVSRYAFTKDDKTGIRGFKFRAAVNKKRFMMGFNQKSTSENYQDLDFSLYFNSNNQVYVYEKGSSKGTFGRWYANSVGVVAVNAVGQVEYIVDGEIRYTSTQTPQFPIYADISMHDEGTVVDSIRWVGTPSSTSMAVGNPVQFTEFKGAASTQVGAIKKISTYGNGWNAGAVSVSKISADDTVRGFAFVPVQNNKHMMIGLNDDSKSQNYNELNRSTAAVTANWACGKRRRTWAFTADMLQAMSSRWSSPKTTRL